MTGFRISTKFRFGGAHCQAPVTLAVRLSRVRPNHKREYSNIGATFAITSYITPKLRILCAPVHVVFNHFQNCVSNAQRPEPLTGVTLRTSPITAVASMKIHKIFILAMPILWLMSCTAPHDNPLDPASPYYVEPNPPVVEPPDPEFSTSLHSVHKDRTTFDLYSIDAELWPETNTIIDSVTVQYKDTTPRITHFLSSSGHWIYTFNDNNVDSDDLEGAVGEPFYFTVYTRFDSIWNVGPAYMIRVLHDTPSTLSPTGGVTVGPFPVLAWNDYNATFPYSYQARVESVDRQTTRVVTVWESDTLQSNTMSVMVADSLLNTAPDDSSDILNYLWTIIVYDNFGNSAESIESTFKVDAGTSR